MHTTRAVTALAGAMLITIALTGAADPAASPAAGGCAPAWNLVNTPAPPGNQTLISAAAATSPKNAWFMGEDLVHEHPWVLHWDGSSVRAATAIPGTPFTARLAGSESFDSATDGWAMGGSANDIVTGIPYAARWHGGRWTITPLGISPDPTSVSREPRPVAVVSLSPSDAWIAGGFGPLGTNGALVEHWDGSSWSIVPNPASDAPRGILYGISAVSATDIWAAGYYQNAAGNDVPLAEHWDGTAWSIVPAPITGPTGTTPSVFNAISADGPDDVWAAGGQIESGTSNFAITLVEHWNGTAWSVVTGLPDLGNSLVAEVYAASPTDLWAIAETASGYEFLHWDGSTWTTVPLPGPQGLGLRDVPLSLTGTGPDNVWMTGYSHDLATNTLSPVIAHLSC